jgi:very-short-patch-repair endonuclease
MFDLSKLEKHTKKQDGLVTRAQALGEGFSQSAIARAVQSELLIPVFRGVYRVRETPVTPKLKRRAALLWAGEGAVLSHLTAGLMWKLEGLGGDAGDVICVSVPASWHLYPPPGIRVVRAKGLRKGRRRIDERTGDQIGLADFAWPERRLIIEVDSRKFHDTTAAFHRDSETRSKYAANGWYVIVATSKRLAEDCDGFIRDVKDGLGLSP